MANWHTNFFDDPTSRAHGRRGDFSQLLAFAPALTSSRSSFSDDGFLDPRRPQYVADLDESLFLATPREDEGMSAGTDPNDKAVPNPDAATSLNPRPAGTPSRTGILVVDDEPAVRQMLEAILKRQGFAALLAASGEEALDVYQRDSSAIALVLLDVRMPGMSGVQTLAVLKELNPSIQCCFMSGYLDAHTKDDLFAAGATAVFAKPFDMSLFVTEIERLTSVSKETRKC